MRGGKGYVTVGLALAAFIVAATGANSFSSGVDRTAQPDLTEAGCTCHGPDGSAGVASPAVEPMFRMSPGAMTYEPGAEYIITVGPASSDVPEAPSGNKGGFNLLVNHGTLEAAPGYEAFTKFHDAGDVGFEATHTLAGDQNNRTYQVTWVAPASDEGAAVFILFVNAVNGDGLNSELDHWNRIVVVVPGPSGELALGGGHGENPVDIGVRWLAHWVGLISFAAVVITLVLYYFVLKYGESIHTTDHRDREGK